MCTSQHLTSSMLVPDPHVLIALITVQLSRAIRTGGLAASLCRDSALEACTIATMQMATWP